MMNQDGPSSRARGTADQAVNFIVPGHSTRVQHLQGALRYTTIPHGATDDAEK